MSSFDYESILSWSDDPDSAQPISAFPEHQKVYATFCAMDEYEDVAYLHDIPLMMRSNVPIAVGDIAIYGMIAEPSDKAISHELKGKDLVTAAWPMSRGWFDRGTFKLGFKDGTTATAERIAEAYRKDKVTLSTLLNKLPRTLVDTRKKVATAVLVDPYSIDAPKDFILGRDSYHGADRGRRSPQKLIAICDGFEKLRGHLIHSSLLRDMVEATHNSKDLFTRFHKDFLHLISISSARDLHEAGEPEKLRSKYLVYEEIASAELARKVMKAAIDIALAGPESLNEFRTCLDEPDAPGGRKLAKHRARDVYMQIFWNLWKRVGTAKKSRPTQVSSNRSISASQQKSAFLKQVRMIEQEYDFSLERIKETANDILEKYFEDRNEPEIVVGSEMSEIHLASEANQNAASRETFFCLQAAALIRNGYCSELLISALTELRKSDIYSVRQSAEWVIELDGQ